MADARMPERFYELALPLLPPETEPGPQGGRRAIRHHTVLKVIWFVIDRNIREVEKSRRAKTLCHQSQRRVGVGATDEAKASYARRNPS